MAIEIVAAMALVIIAAAAAITTTTTITATTIKAKPVVIVAIARLLLAAVTLHTTMLLTAKCTECTITTANYCLYRQFMDDYYSDYFGKNQRFVVHSFTTVSKRTAASSVFAQKRFNSTSDRSKYFRCSEVAATCPKPFCKQYHSVCYPSSCIVILNLQLPCRRSS
jgi:type II secretory pathway pseudopilin PulG